MMWLTYGGFITFILIIVASLYISNSMYNEAQRSLFPLMQQSPILCENKQATHGPILTPHGLLSLFPISPLDHSTLGR